MKKNTQFLLMSVALLCTTVMLAQSTITGTIKDAEINSPLPGANVIEKGASNGVITDFDGNFTLKTKNGNRANNVHNTKTEEDLLKVFEKSFSFHSRSNEIKFAF